MHNLYGGLLVKNQHLVPTPAPERWVPVTGFEGAYEVSDLGRVRSLDRDVGTLVRKFWKGKILQPFKAGGRFAYNQVKLHGVAGRFVHALVMEAFIGPRPEGLQVAHNDGNPTNNQLASLRYATPKSNASDKVLHGKQLRGPGIGRPKLTEHEAREIVFLRGQETCRSIADRFGIGIAQVSRIRTGRNRGQLR